MIFQLPEVSGVLQMLHTLMAQLLHLCHRVVKQWSTGLTLLRLLQVVVLLLLLTLSSLQLQVLSTRQDLFGVLFQVKKLFLLHSLWMWKEHTDLISQTQQTLHFLLDSLIHKRVQERLQLQVQNIQLV